MGHKVPWKTGVLICHPVTSRLIFPQKEAVLSPCNFATTHLTASILNLYLPLTSQPMKRRTLSQRPILTLSEDTFWTVRSQGPEWRQRHTVGHSYLSLSLSYPQF